MFRCLQSPAPRDATCVLLLAFAGAPACGDDPDLLCSQSFLRYDNFGAPFITNWCRACHRVDLPPDMRQDSRDDINFDTLDEIRAWSPRIPCRRRAAPLPASAPC